MQTNNPKPTKIGRPAVGTLFLKARIPPWMMSQLNALVAERCRDREREYARRGVRSAKACRRPHRAEVVRDVMRMGLVSMHRAGVQAPGFRPAHALREARLKGEPE